MAVLTLKKTGQQVLVDDEDVVHCRALQMGRDGIIYARWWVAKRQVRKALHRLIMGEPEGLQVDHVNRDRLDNRRQNLRLATASQNTCNRARPALTKYRHRGIVFMHDYSHKNLKKPWHARIKVRGKTFSCGYYETAEEAALAYNQMAIKLHGEFAVLNEVELS